MIGYGISTLVIRTFQIVRYLSSIMAFEFTQIHWIPTQSTIAQSMYSAAYLGQDSIQYCVPRRLKSFIDRGMIREAYCQEPDHAQLSHHRWISPATNSEDNVAISLCLQLLKVATVIDLVPQTWGLVTEECRRRVFRNGIFS